MNRARCVTSALFGLRLICLLIFICDPSKTAAEPIRLATYDVELSRKGPGLMLRDILRAQDQVAAITQVITHIAPDILFLQGIDHDVDLLGANALRDHFAARGLSYPHVFARAPNTGLPTGLDMNGDGKRHTAADAQGYGRFRGASGNLLLSRWPVDCIADFTALLWRDLPEAQLPVHTEGPFPSPEAQAIQRLSSTGHWMVSVATPQGPLTVMLFAAGPPVFDGPEDRNGLRNADEIRLWHHVLDGTLGWGPEKQFVLMGGANLDPDNGEGRHAAIQSLLTDPRLQDPHAKFGPTVEWAAPSPGNLRVDYLLPSRDLEVLDAGVFWPKPPSAEADLLRHKDTRASRHHLVWADIGLRTSTDVSGKAVAKASVKSVATNSGTNASNRAPSNRCGVSQR